MAMSGWRQCVFDFKSTAESASDVKDLVNPARVPRTLSGLRRVGFSSWGNRWCEARHTTRPTLASPSPSKARDKATHHLAFCRQILQLSPHPLKRQSQRLCDIRVQLLPVQLQVLKNRFQGVPFL